MNDVIAHVMESIVPASIAQATAATQKLLRSGLTAHGDGLAEIAVRLCAARHSPCPSLTRKKVLVLAADHGVAYSGVDLGLDNPSTQGLLLMAKGEAAINAAVRSTETELVLVDIGLRGGHEHDLGKAVLSFRCGNGTKDFSQEDAMTETQAKAAIQTGIALAFSLADAGLDILALGQMSVGSQPSSLAIISVLSGKAPQDLGPQDADVVALALARRPLHDALPLEILSAFGGYETAVFVGVILAAASIYVPIVLDGHGTSAAAYLATQMCPDVRGYLFASHLGGIPAHRHALEALQLTPPFAVGLAQGEGTGAVLSIPMLEAATQVMAQL